MEMDRMKENEYRARMQVLTTGITGLRRLHKDRDIGSKNFQLYPVRIGRKWYKKGDRRK